MWRLYWFTSDNLIALSLIYYVYINNTAIHRYHSLFSGVKTHVRNNYWNISFYRCRARPDYRIYYIWNKQFSCHEIMRFSIFNFLRFWVEVGVGGWWLVGLMSPITLQEGVVLLLHSGDSFDSTPGYIWTERNMRIKLVYFELPFALIFMKYIIKRQLWFN